MPHDRKAAIRQDLVEAQRGLLDALDQVGPADWLRPSPNEGWTVRDLTIAIRAAVTGRKVGPPLYESLALLGKDRALERLEAAQELIG